MAIAASETLTRIEDALAALFRGPNSARTHQRLVRLTGVDLDRAGFFLLRRLAEAGTVRLSELAQRAGLDLSTVSRLVQQLERRGFVARERDPLDGRACVLSVTRAGLRVDRRLREARRATVAEALAEWSDDDRERFAQLLGRFADDFSRYLSQG